MIDWSRRRDPPVPRAYRFGAFRVDLLRQELSGPGGRALNLSARAYDVLVYLLQNRDRVVSKNELMKAVWPRSVVEENNLNQAVTILRRALGDRRDSAQFVRTIAGRGYRFVGEVSEETTGSDSEGSTTAMPATAGPAVPAAASVPKGPIPPAPASDYPPQAPSRSTSGHGGPDPRRRRLLLGMGAATAAVAALAWFLSERRTGGHKPPFESLAVLPFRPLLEGAGDPVWEFGMTDTLIMRLSPCRDSSCGR